MEILYADPSLLAVNKPAGLAAVPGGWEKGEPSLLEELEAEYGRLWIIHRLDKVTSGVMLFARTAEAHRTLSMLFETHAARKAYHAILVGEPKWDEHTARHPLRINVGHSHRTIVDHSKGKPSETSFRILERYTGYSLVEAIPATGRTHQIRVHAAALWFPILADILYGAPPTDLISRPALHAYSLHFDFDGKSFALTAPYPDDYVRTLERLKVGTSTE